MAKLAFIGSANAMGMMYALDLKDRGHEVTYFVTTNHQDTLSRPECHYKEVQYPYPAWIVERVVDSPLRANLLPRLYIRDLLDVLDKSDYVFLSGMYVMLANHLKTAKAIFLSHGSDFDEWCNKANYKIFLSKILRLSEPLLAVISILGIHEMRSAFKKCETFITFPEGLSAGRDMVLHELKKNWTGLVIPRFDVSFRPLSGISRTLSFDSKKMVLLCAVRCSFVQKQGGSDGDLKGTDTIIKGIAKYVHMNRLPVELHMFEKGNDLELAKKICDETGLTRYITWHKEMPFNKLLNFYSISDVCFDQVSKSWLGAIGCYALYLGKPLIANSRSEVLGKIWNQKSPVCEAKNEEEIANWLLRLEDRKLQIDISRQSSVFAETNLGPELVIERIEKILR
jgi:glycosyltransferase involved in cell wall biosynthesis